MRSIEANYKDIERKNPNLATYPCLALAVRGRKFSRDTIARFFVKIMPKDEYDRTEKKNLIDQLTGISNGSEENEIMHKKFV